MRGHHAPFASAAQITLQTGILTAIFNTTPMSAQAQSSQPLSQHPANPHVQATSSDDNFNSGHMPPGAFLKQPGPDVAHLVEQVRSNPDVAIRYSRLFHLPVKMVPAAFAQLHLATLQEDHIMQVHFVRKETVTETVTVLRRDPETNRTVRRLRTRSTTHDSLVYKPRRVKAGTKIYSLPDGTPLLIRVCGNPIRTRVAPEFYSRVRVPSFDPGEKLADVTTTNDANLHTVTRAVEPPDPPLPVVTMVAAENVLPIEAIPVLAPVSPAELPKVALKPVYQWVHSFSGLWGFGGAGALGLIALADTGSTRAPIVIPPGGNPPPFVPPPSTNPPVGTAPPTTGPPTPAEPAPPTTGTPVVTTPGTPPEEGTTPGAGTTTGTSSGTTGGEPGSPPLSPPITSTGAPDTGAPGTVPEPTTFVLGAALLVVSICLAGRHNIRRPYPGLPQLPACHTRSSVAGPV